MGGTFTLGEGKVKLSSILLRQGGRGKRKKVLSNVCVFFLNHLPRAYSSSGSVRMSTAADAFFTASALSIRNGMAMARDRRTAALGLHRWEHGSNMDTDSYMDITPVCGPKTLRRRL